MNLVMNFGDEFGEDFGDKFCAEFGESPYQVITLVIVLVINLVMNFGKSCFANFCDKFDTKFCDGLSESQHLVTKFVTKWGHFQLITKLGDKVCDKFEMLNVLAAF